MKPKVLRRRRHNGEAESTSSRTCKIYSACGERRAPPLRVAKHAPDKNGVPKGMRVEIPSRTPESCGCIRLKPSVL